MAAASKLEIINECLLITGQNVVAVADNGQPEWNASSAGYEMGLQRLLDEHDWKFAKQAAFVTERSDSGDPKYVDAYAKPADAMHIVRVTDQYGADVGGHRVMGNSIWVNNTEGIRVEYIADLEPNHFPGLFLTALKYFIFAAIYRWKQSPADADREERKAEKMLALARPRGDIEEPAKTRFISTLAQARRTRRG